MKYIEYGYHYAYSETGSKERPPPNRMKVREKKQIAIVGLKPRLTNRAI